MAALSNTGIEISRDPETNMVRLRTVFNQVTMSEATAAKLAVLLFPELLTVARACLGYFAYMRAKESDMTPAEAWLTEIRNAISKAEGN